MAYVYNEDTGNYDYVPDETTGNDSPVAPPAEPPKPSLLDRLHDPNANPSEFGAPLDGNEWYWTGSAWGQRAIRPQSQTSDQSLPEKIPTTYGTGRRLVDYGGGGNFEWPHFTAPQYAPGPAFQAPPPFSFAEFTPPKASEIGTDPSYQLRRTEGERAIAHNAAAKGLTRLPETVKALAGWNQDFASKEYGNIFDRSAQTWNMNRNNAADAYSTNYGISRDVWDRGEQQHLNTFDRNYKGALDEFEYNQWRPASLTFADMYNRWKAGLDAQTELARGGRD